MCGGGSAQPGGKHHEDEQEQPQNPLPRVPAFSLARHDLRRIVSQPPVGPHIDDVIQLERMQLTWPWQKRGIRRGKEEDQPRSTLPHSSLNQPSERAYHVARPYTVDDGTPALSLDHLH